MVYCKVKWISFTLHFKPVTPGRLLLAVQMIGLVSSFNMWNLTGTGRCSSHDFTDLVKVSPYLFIFVPQPKHQGLTTAVPFACYQTYSRLEVAILQNLCGEREWCENGKQTLLTVCISAVLGLYASASWL